MNRKLLFDASVYIQAIREGRWELLNWRRYRKSVMHFSAVVGSELLRGIREGKEAQLIENLWQDFKKIRRLVLPNANDWHEAGLVLARIASKHGYETIGQAKLVHDALIALSARRIGITVVTLNLADFLRIAEFRRFSVLSFGDIST
jgi:predicted nucleic acid-binding protein